MRTRNEEAFQEKKEMIMVACFECYSKNGLYGTGIDTIAKACGVSKSSLYTYFKDVDDLIIQSTEYCMSKVEDDFMKKSPVNLLDVDRFIDEIPYWTAKKHGKKYRLMYQVYTHPKYIEYGKKFFKGVNERYTEYAKQLESRIGISYKVITPMIFILIRACVHYALFEDEYYLKSQTELLKRGVHLLAENNFNKPSEN